MKIQRFEDTQAVYAILDAVQIRAAAFIRQHVGAHLERHQLITRTMGYLRDSGFEGASDTTLERATVRALTEYEAQHQACYIDVDETTAYQVAVRDPATKALRIFTVGDLMRLVKTPDLQALPTPSKRAACAGQFL